MTVLDDAAVEAPGRWKPYPGYRDSGLDWLGDIPTHWCVKRLKTLAAVRVSNVDKKSAEGQQPVGLCNYTDVYYHERITAGLDFMAATATPEQVRRFALREGDVLITKDSESWTDIAVPAHVAEDLADVLCGYHLALIRPQAGTEGAYLARAFAATGPRHQFHVAANGITRFGLSNDAIRTGSFPYPPADEQRATVAFLDRETARIDALITKKERLIELAAESRRALVRIHVTGRRLGATIRDSQIPWIGAVPAHWSIKPLKHLVACIDGKRIPLNAEQRAEMRGPIPYWGANGVVDHVDAWLFDEELVLLGEDGAPFFDPARDVAFAVSGRIWVNNHAHVLRPSSAIDHSFLGHALNCVDYAAFIDGTTRDKLTQGDMGEIPIQVPPLDEQRDICRAIDDDVRRVDTLVATIRTHIGLLREYRSALISAAVTGKIDVRDEVAA